MVRNQSLVFKKVPSGEPKLGQDLLVEDIPLDIEQELEPGSILIKNLYISLDPYMRGRLRDPSIKSYSPAFDLGQPLVARTLGKVISSTNDSFKTGQIVVASAKIAEYDVLSGQTLQSVRVVENPHNIDIAHYLGALGMPGLTAYASLYDIGQPKKGETIFVSAASGAVGQIVSQLAKHEGLKVIGSVGDARKVEYMKKELGIDAVFNYKEESTANALKRLAPNGIDIYYDNVGGETLETAIDAMNDFGRIIACGSISQYNLKPDERYGIKNLFNFTSKRLTMRGFIVGDANMGPKYIKDHQTNVGKWLADGSFKGLLHVENGIERSGEAFLTLFSGKNLGKVVVKVE